MSKPRIGVIVSSVREGRFADRVLEWFMPIANARNDLEFEILDLKDFPLPFYDEAALPAMGGPAKNEVANKWRARLAEMDGFVLITAEYTRGPTAALKNALDWAYGEWNRKPAAFVAYGSAGGARAVEQLRSNLVELQVTPVRHAVHVGGADFMGMLMQGKTFADFPYYDNNAKDLLDHLGWWANTLKAGRAESAGQKSAA
ncbi:MAG TPA: NAD(P)H-dependent oxidoreductase [Devosiaceae bacterium]